MLVMFFGTKKRKEREKSRREILREERETKRKVRIS